jgi:ribonucleotide monophosphatase NagD (HAD superfamily)
MRATQPAAPDGSFTRSIYQRPHPMREMAGRYNTVLVVGGEGEKCRQVAEGYGFKDVVTPGDIIKDNQDTTPFRKLTEEEYKHSRARNFGETDIEAIFVFADSRDWVSDQQIILDLLMSKNGRLGTRSETFEEGPPVFFSHNDVVWSTSHRRANKQTAVCLFPSFVCLYQTNKQSEGLEIGNQSIRREARLFE